MTTSSAASCWPVKRRGQRRHPARGRVVERGQRALVAGADGRNQRPQRHFVGIEGHGAGARFRLAGTLCMQTVSIQGRGSERDPENRRTVPLSLVDRCLGHGGVPSSRRHASHYARGLNLDVPGLDRPSDTPPGSRD